ncbi:hypothetical protein V1512DRAFT_265269 [Lipomyces arxii]|uniref:uncharacterized protein n=1 Tax=Lipomyces arxii TaxID=56418 RepID=UPI0034CD6B27
MPLKQRLFFYNWTNELSFLAVVLGFIGLHLVGAYLNKRKATNWMKAQLEGLKLQFYQVGFDASVNILEPGALPFSKLLKRLGPVDYVFYATGRANVSLLHGKITLVARHNVIMVFLDYVLSFVFGYDAPKDTVEFIVKPSDSEKEKSTYDGFVFAVVHKDYMKRVREENYDLSLTKTSDHPKLPVSMTVMCESAEIRETFLTPELIEAVTNAESVFEYLVLSDLPVARPRTVEEFVPSKRGLLSLTMARTADEHAATSRLVSSFLNTIDVAVAKAHWRSEVMRKLKATRDEEVRKLQKIADDEKAEEIANARAKEKKEQKKGLAGLSAEDQKKASAKEREKEIRRMRGKQTRKM